MIQEANLTWRYVDTESNLIMPWYTFDALKWLKQQDVSRWSVFEYGSGYSTIWWRLNADNVISIEHNREWAIAMGAFHKEDKENYIKSTAAGYFADCIIVDGEWRDECVAFARLYVKSGGHIIVDNYGQEDFPPAEKIDEILHGWTKKVFRQYNHTSWATAVFTKP